MKPLLTQNLFDFPTFFPSYFSIVEKTVMIKNTFRKVVTLENRSRISDRKVEQRRGGGNNKNKIQFLCGIVFVRRVTDTSG